MCLLCLHHAKCRPVLQVSAAAPDHVKNLTECYKSKPNLWICTLPPQRLICAHTVSIPISPRLNSDGHDDQKLRSDDPPTHNRFIIPERDTPERDSLLCVVLLRFVVTSPEVFRCHLYFLYCWLLGEKTCIQPFTCFRKPYSITPPL